jgi:hypothetical protein
MKRTITNVQYIVESTADKVGWVAGYPDGSMVITWDHQRFINTIQVMVDTVPQTADEQKCHMDKMGNLVEWLSEHHFEKMHISMD